MEKEASDLKGRMEKDTKEVRERMERENQERQREAEELRAKIEREKGALEKQLEVGNKGLEEQGGPTFRDLGICLAVPCLVGSCKEEALKLLCVYLAQIQSYV